MSPDGAKLSKFWKSARWRTDTYQNIIVRYTLKDNFDILENMQNMIDARTVFLGQGFFFPL